MATLARVSSRTIRRHIAKLEQANVIVRKAFYGTQADYELKINPELLSIAHSIDNSKSDQSQKGKEQKVNKNTKWTNCPLTDSINIINNIVKAVDNSCPKRPVTTKNDPENTLKRREPTLTGGDNHVKMPLQQIIPLEIQLKFTEQNSGNVVSGYTREKVRINPQSSGQY
ncbi:helix-turn-helix domain-containing protein [Fulvivirga sediminis]|uniref:Uncharacterized protein n=1 Tax=Fulvivirga sediminis TaxID=2803949 RepID=A0A937FBE4_9BACT|nr:hypothetical protein [Fulvivirga sediminis]MBL3658876.1 hypothetical protein [Fulvivirga sediminis]